MIALAQNADRLIGEVKHYYNMVDKSTGVSAISDETRIGVGTWFYDDQFQTTKAEPKVISELFASDGIYERSGGWAPFKGRGAIRHFFADERTLTGNHAIAKIAAIPGVHENVREAVTRYFPDLDQQRCMTVLVEGNFTGAQCFIDRHGPVSITNGLRDFMQSNARKENGFATRHAPQKPIAAASGIGLHFKDYWVWHGGKVLYRYSDIQTPNLSHENPADKTFIPLIKRDPPGRERH